MVLETSVPATTEDDLAGIREEAACWVVSLDEAGPGERERLQAECEAWQAGDPKRRRVFAQMQEIWSSTDPGRERGGRRRVGVLGVVLAIALAGTQLPWNVWTADYRTAAGQIREVELADGSALVLDSDTAVDVAYHETGRVIRLERGQLMATVNKDRAGRPFSVEVPDGSVTALGTRYSVQRTEGHSIVSVYESSVRLAPRDAGSRGATLAAGQRARLSSAGVSEVQPTGGRDPDWVDGRLVFNDAPLAAVVDRLSRYRRGWLVMDDGLSSPGRRFTGVLPAEDSEAALDLLADAMALEVQRLTPYFVRLTRR